VQKAKIYLLLLALFVSLGFNFYLYFSWPEDQVEGQVVTEAESLDDVRSYNPLSVKTESLTNQSNATEQQTASNAFRRSDFEVAVDHYSQIKQLDDEQAQRLLDEWLVQARSWLRNGRMKQAEQFITAFLDFQPYNLEVLQLEAMRLSFINQTSNAISVYQTIIENSLDSDVQLAMLQQIHGLVNQQQLTLQKSGQWQALIDFVEPLIYDEPDYLPYQLMVAEAMVEVKQFASAKAYLQGLLTSDDYVVQAEALLQKIIEAELGEQAVALAQIGAHYLVTGRFNQQADVTLMIDTGASLSVITQQAFDQLQLWQSPQYVRNADMRTAGGIVNAPIYQFEQFDIGGFVVNQIQFVVMDIEDFRHAEGLLGMNFLANFDFKIDQQRHQLHLKYR